MSRFLALALMGLSAVAAVPAPEAAEPRAAFDPEIVDPQGRGFTLRTVKTGSVDLNEGWYFPVTIGTPPQSFLFLGDSGEPDISVASTLLPKDKRTSAPAYNPHNSTTAKQLKGYTYKLHYASSFEATGVVYQDTFQVGGLTLDDMYIMVQTNHSGKKPSGARSGTLGLNFDHSGQGSKPKKVPNWLQTITPKLESGLFTLDYNKAKNEGTWDFGYIDKTKYTGEIGYAPVTKNQPFWIIETSGFEYANGTMNNTPWHILADSGTAGSRVPPSVASAYFSQIKGAKYDGGAHGWVYPCSEDLVDFKVAIGKTFRGTIPASYLKGSSVGNDMCDTHMGVGKEGAKWEIFGHTFLEALFVVYDWDNSQLGFANKNLN